MIRVVFKNLKSSEMVKQMVLNKISDLTAKFPELTRHRISATVSMENSPIQAGRDSFGLKLMINGKLFKNLILEKHAENLYEAVSDVTHVLIERLGRTLDKRRTLKRAKARNFLTHNDSWEHWYESAV